MYRPPFPSSTGRTATRCNWQALCGLLLLAIALLARAEQPPRVEESQLVAQDKHLDSAQIILHIIDSYHYKKKPLNDSLSSQILDEYLDSLDSNRSFFTRQDIDRFEQYRYVMDDALEEPDLNIAFDIFKLYRKRVDERIDHALTLVGDEFDFTIDEEYRFDRRDTEWPADEAELEEIWRKRVKNDYLNLKLADESPEEIRETLTKRYERQRTSTFQLNANDVFQTFINAYTTSIEPHTAYFSPRASENFDISMRLSLEGIGAVLRGETDYTTVQEIIPGGPADLSDQLHAEDRIIGVGQDREGEIVDVIGWRLDDVVDLIRGPKGSVVRLEILPNGADGPSETIVLTRDKIKLEEQAAKSEVLELDTGSRIGVIEIPTFYSDFAAQARGEKNYKSTTRDARRLLEELKSKQIDGLVIDLRGNGGGSLSEALNFTGLFIEKGPIVQTKDSSGRIDINRDRDPEIVYGGPLAVLVDRSSASASEIFAGAIQDYQRGIIIGEPTFGKGTVQNIVNLNRFIRNSDTKHGRLKTTVAQFFRISGGSNQHKGVVPDIIYPTVDNDDKHGERALDNALPWEKIEPARYMLANAPVDRYDNVRRMHKERIESNHLFQLLLEQVALAEEADDRTTVSLMESRRKEEREEREAARHRLQNEFRKAQGLEPIPEDADESAYEDIEPIDILLRESAHILEDLSRPPGSTTTASKS